MKKRLPALLCVLALAFTLIGCGGGGGGGPKTYDVSGTVFLNGGNASPGDVRITFVDVDDATKVLFDAAQPDSSGKWSKGGLSGTVRIKPVLDGYSFEPSSLVVSDTRDDVNFTGTVVTDTYTISGCVTDANGEGLSDVRITVTGSFETKTYDTDDNGLWSIGEVYGTVTVTPTMDGWIFEPENRELVVESDTGGLDFTGRQVYSIYGYVKDGNGMGLPGVTITATGEFEGERSAVSSGPDGYWRIDKVYGTVTVTPNDNTRFFDPPYRVLDVPNTTNAGFFIGMLIYAGTPPVAGGGLHSLALKSNTVWAWGNNEYGQLGNGTGGDGVMSTTPVQVKDSSGLSVLSDVIAIAAGYSHSLALKSNGTVWAWGGNGSGQLGDNTTDDRFLPVQVKDSSGLGVLSNIIAISAGRSHSLALTSDRKVWAWGNNKYGQLGNGTRGDGVMSTTPVQVKDSSGLSVLSDVIAIAAGYDHSLALTSDGTVWAWGYNELGQLGDGKGGLPIHMSTIPVQVSDLSGVIAIAASGWHSLALKKTEESGGTVWAWGYNHFGQLGDNTEFDSRLTPVQVMVDDTESLSRINAIAAGGAHSLALKPYGGSVYSWGSNEYGQLGLGNGGPGMFETVAVEVTSLRYVMAIACGGHHSLAVDKDGMVWAWGRNDYGQLGNGTTEHRNTPVQVMGLN